MSVPVPVLTCTPTSICQYRVYADLHRSKPGQHQPAQVSTGSTPTCTGQYRVNTDQPQCVPTPRAGGDGTEARELQESPDEADKDASKAEPQQQ